MIAWYDDNVNDDRFDENEEIEPEAASEFAALSAAISSLRK